MTATFINGTKIADDIKREVAAEVKSLKAQPGLAVVLVGNDAAWGQIRLPQVQFHGVEKSPATTLAPTRYDRIVEAMGGYGEHVNDPAQIRPALERAVASGTVACVNVMLDPEAPAASGAQGYAI